MVPRPRRTPPLSPEGALEVLAELKNGSPDTPERRASFERARAMSFLVDREMEQHAKKRRR